MVSCGARLSPFDIGELRALTEYDEMDLESIGKRKSALFIIISDTDATFNFLVSIMYSQLFNLLCELADDKYGGRLPVHVRCRDRIMTIAVRRPEVKSVLIGDPADNFLGVTGFKWAQAQHKHPSFQKL